MGDEASEHSNAWTFLSDSKEFNTNVFETTKRFQCKFPNCNRGFTHSQSRSRHYRQDHYTGTKEETTTSNHYPSSQIPMTKLIVEQTPAALANRESSLFNNNTVESSLNAPSAQQLIRESPQIKEVINLCQSLFNSENAETAIAMIKGSRMVHDHALELRNAIEALYTTKKRESKKHQEKMRKSSQRLNEQMILANATQQEHKTFETVLTLFFESDSKSIQYLSTFHSVLGMALLHTKMFSERVNVDIKRTRLLKIALNEIVDQDNNRGDEFSGLSSKRSRSASSPDPVNVFLCESEDESAGPVKRLNGNVKAPLDEDGCDVVENVMRRSRNTLRGAVNKDYTLKDNGSDLTDLYHVSVLHDSGLTGDGTVNIVPRAESTSSVSALLSNARLVRGSDAAVGLPSERPATEGNLSSMYGPAPCHAETSPAARNMSSQYGAAALGFMSSSSANGHPQLGLPAEQGVHPSGPQSPETSPVDSLVSGDLFEIETDDYSILLSPTLALQQARPILSTHLEQQQQQQQQALCAESSWASQVMNYWSQAGSNENIDFSGI